MARIAAPPANVRAVSTGSGKIVTPFERHNNNVASDGDDAEDEDEPVEEQGGRELRHSGRRYLGTLR
jgi:hypothetical protein